MGRPRQQAHPGDDCLALGLGQAGERGPDPVGIQQGTTFPQSDPRVGETDLDPTGIPLIPGADNQPQASQPRELKGDGPGSNPHASGELADREGLEGIELLQHTGQVPAQPGAGTGLLLVAPATGGVNGGIRREDGVDRVVQHGGKLVILF